jgi:hypothetical protein
MLLYKNKFELFFFSIYRNELNKIIMRDIIYINLI